MTIDYLQQIKKLVLDELDKEPVRIILFGSRARGNYHQTSDVDIGVIPRKSTWNSNKLSLLKEKLEDLDVPYKVDVVNLNETSEEFKEEVLKGAVIWKD